MCRTVGNHCLQIHTLAVKPFQAQPFGKAVPACAGKLAAFLGYGGMTPGPTIIATV